MSQQQPIPHHSTPAPRLAGTAGAIAGAIIVVLGVVAAVDADAASNVWFASAGVASLLFAVCLLGLRAAAGALPVSRRALGVAAATITLFGLSHIYALVDEDTAILLFSVFMVLTAIGLIVAGVPILRQRDRGWPAWLPLVTGVWPLLTIPAGAAIGDVPHFGAVAVWGGCWLLLGLAVRASTIVAPSASVGRSERVQVSSS